MVAGLGLGLCLRRGPDDSRMELPNVAVGGWWGWDAIPPATDPGRAEQIRARATRSFVR